MTERFGDLLARHHFRLLRHARRLTGDAAEAEDLVQDVLIKFTTCFQERPIPDERGCMAWMTTALNHAFISTLRKAHVQEKADSDPTLRPPSSSDEAPEPPLWALVTDEQLKQAMSMLSAKQREVFEAAVAGRKYADIAAELGINVNAVAKRLFDARLRLRKILKKILRSEPQNGI